MANATEHTGLVRTLEPCSKHPIASLQPSVCLLNAPLHYSQNHTGLAPFTANFYATLDLIKQIK